MLNIIKLIGLLVLIMSSSLSYSQVTEHAVAPLSLKIMAPSTLVAGKETVINLQLIKQNDHQSLTLDDLKEAHTSKLHLLIIDPSLTDYHHIHPVPTNRDPRIFTFRFIPKKSGYYRVWADVIPLSTKQQEYIMADIGDKPFTPSTIDKTINTQLI